MIAAASIVPSYVYSMDLRSSKMYVVDLTEIKLLRFQLGLKYTIESGFQDMYEL